MSGKALEKTGSKGIHWPLASNAAVISEIGVPAFAVNVNSVGSYSVIQVNPRVSIRQHDSLAAIKVSFVRFPCGRTKSLDSTASIA